MTYSLVDIMFLITVMNQTICFKIWEVFSDCRIFRSCFAPQSGGWWRLHEPVRVQTPAQPRLWGEHKSDTGGAVRSFCCLLCLLRLLYIHYAEDFPLKQVQQSVHWDSWTFGLSIVDWIWRFKFKCFVVYWTLLFYKQGFNPINGKFSFWRVIIGFISVLDIFGKGLSPSLL